MNVHMLLEMAADATPDRVAVTCGARSTTYSALLAQSRATATWIDSQSCDTVCYVGLNDTLFPTLLFGSSLAERPFTSINYRLADSDLRRLIERTASALVIADKDVLPRLEGIDGVKVVYREKVPTSRVADRYAIVPEERAYDSENVSVLLFTSGTTSEPKAAMLRHRHLTSYIISTLEFMAAGDEEATLISVPPYHIAGISAVLSSVFSGRRMVLLPSFSPEHWVEAAAKERVTHAMVVPTMLGRILDVLEKDNVSLPTLRHLSYGGGRMPETTIARALRLLPQVDFVNAYGLTETSSTIAVLTPEDHRAAIASDEAHMRRRLGSVGVPSPAIELEVRGPDGARLGPNASGEIWVRGDQVSGEYRGRHALDAEGWYHTNDCGWIDDEGYLFVEGRLDDVIVRGGENISPGEIEDCLRTHAGVSDVAVVGVADNEWGEQIVAFVVPNGDCPKPQQLQTLVRERLRSSRVPSDVVFMTELPYNETGKVLRRVLKASYAST
jgi:fatty-acyl-CoA synthase